MLRLNKLSIDILTIDPLIFNLAQSFTRTVRQFDYVTIGFRFVLLSLSLRGNPSTKQMKK